MRTDLNKPSHIELEDFGSQGMLRILRILSEEKELNLSQLGRKSGMNYSGVIRHVERLVEMGLATETRYGSIRMIKANFHTFNILFKKEMGVRLIVR